MTSEHVIHTRRDGHVRRLVSGVVQLAALVSIAHLVLLGGAKSPLFDALATGFGLLGLSVGPNLFLAVLLGVLGAALRTGKRAALQVLCAMLGVTALLSSLIMIDSDPAPDLTTVLGVVLPVGGIATLYTTRQAFQARVAAGAWRRAAATAGFGLVAAVGGGWLLTGWFPSTLSAPQERLGWVLDQLAWEMLGPLENGASGPDWLAVGLDLWASGVLVTAIALYLRGVAHRRAISDDEELTIRTLVARYGGADSLEFFATRRDKSVILAADGQSGVAYRLVAGTSVASGDPLGPENAWPDAIEAWLREAERYGWRPVVLAASERGAAAYLRHGLRALEIGDEAILDVDTFLAEARTHQSVRRAAHRLAMSGYRCTIRYQDAIPRDDLDDYVRCARHWRSGAAERGFSMALGRLGDPADTRCLIVEARSPDGQLRGLLTFVPWGADGLSLDLMHRAPTAPNGITEFMIDEVVVASCRLGITRISLNFVAFRAALENGVRLGAGPLQRAWRATLGLVSRSIQLESLYRANLKYAPTWSPRFLCYPSTTGLHRAAIASILAEGFLAPLRVRGTRDTQVRGSAFTEHVRALDPAPKPALLPHLDQVELDRIRAHGVDPYPSMSTRLTSIAQIRRHHPGLPADTRTGTEVTVAGRVGARRNFGALAFATLHSDGATMQVILESSTTRARHLATWKGLVRTDDLVVVHGEVITSRTGELSVLATRWSFAAKSMRPATHRGRHHGRDTTEQPADSTVERAQNVLHTAGFTPVSWRPAHPLLGDGPAGRDRMPCEDTGERVFAVDEGSALHLRHGYADHTDMRHLLEHLVGTLSERNPAWDRVSVLAAIAGATGTAAAVAGSGEGEHLLPTIYERMVVPATIAPTLYVGFPVSLAPLARACPQAPHLAEHWRLVAGGMEIAIGETALTDPVELRHRLTATAAADLPATTIDALAAFDHGVAPFALLRLDLRRLTDTLTPHAATALRAETGDPTLPTAAHEAGPPRSRPSDPSPVIALASATAESGESVPQHLRPNMNTPT